MASLNEDETSGSENGKQDENANESKNQDFSFQIGGTWVTFFNFSYNSTKLFSSRSFPEDLLPKLPTVSPTSNHSKSASQSNISVKPTTKTFARSLTQEINLDEFLKPKASASEGTLDATKRPSATQEVHVLPKKAISIEDDVCSTDSSLIEDVEVKKKKRKLFNFSKRSKKGEKSWVELLLSYFIKLVDTLNLPALFSSTYFLANWLGGKTNLPILLEFFQFLLRL